MSENTKSHNIQKKIAVVSDLCGFGRCSAGVALPIISAMGLQCCLMPTSVFSNHTGYEDYFCRDMTEDMPACMERWKKLGLKFEGITTGFLGSARQIDMVKGFVERFAAPDAKVLVDPVMGDHGKIYSSYTSEMVERMHELLPYAHIITPNLTEACILSGESYREDFSDEELEHICLRLSQAGPEKIALSGVVREGEKLCNFVYEKGKPSIWVCEDKIGEHRAGTGDVFASILAADMVKGVPFALSVEKAAAFIAKSLERTCRLGIYPEDGICFEEFLWELGKPCAKSGEVKLCGMTK